MDLFKSKKIKNLETSVGDCDERIKKLSEDFNKRLSISESQSSNDISYLNVFSKHLETRIDDLNTKLSKIDEMCNKMLKENLKEHETKPKRKYVRKNKKVEENSNE